MSMILILVLTVSRISLKKNKNAREKVAIGMNQTLHYVAKSPNIQGTLLEIGSEAMGKLGYTSSKCTFFSSCYWLNYSFHQA